MSVKLRELIRSVRACKTAADERAVIAKECALIRTSFKAAGQFRQMGRMTRTLHVRRCGLGIGSDAQCTAASALHIRGARC